MSFFIWFFKFFPKIFDLFSYFQSVFHAISYSLSKIIHFLLKFVPDIMNVFVFILAKLLLLLLPLPSLFLFELPPDFSLLILHFFSILPYMFFGILGIIHPLSKLSFMSVPGGLWFSLVFWLLLAMQIIHKLLSKVHVVPAFWLFISSILIFLISLTLLELLLDFRIF